MYDIALTRSAGTERAQRIPNSTSSDAIAFSADLVRLMTTGAVAAVSKRETTSVVLAGEPATITR